MDATVYSELLDEGATPVAWATTRQSISLRDVMNVALKSLSLMGAGEKRDWNTDQPRTIIDKEDAFSIIPYPDQDADGMSYFFTYQAGDTRVPATVSVLAPASDRHQLFVHHETIKYLLKHAAFEILKIVVTTNSKAADKQITKILEATLEKVNRLAT